MCVCVCVCVCMCMCVCVCVCVYVYVCVCVFMYVCMWCCGVLIHSCVMYRTLPHYHTTTLPHYAVLDAADMNEWNGVVGNVQKLLLGALTVVFDSIFIFQHYVLYKGMSPRSMSMMEAYPVQWAKTEDTPGYDSLLTADDYEIRED